tara:strand:- start:533 stop:1039 length:507 start_codon:yes stop_codon:yes gene_type:complete
MATPTYTLIDSVTLGSSAASINFTGIPTDGTYRDLVVVFTGGRDSSGNLNAGIQFNADTGSNYNYVSMGGDGTNTDSASSANNSRIIVGITSGAGFIDGLIVVNILDYAQTDKHKSGLYRMKVAGSGDVYAVAFRYASTSAMSQVNFISPFGGAYASGTKAYLYGIAG